MHEYNLRTNSAHLDFIPGSATGQGMTFSKLFLFPVPVFPLALPLSALPKPSDALPQPKETPSEFTSPTKRGANGSSSEHPWVLHPPSAHQRTPSLSPLPTGPSHGSFFPCLCKGLNIGTSCQQFQPPNAALGKIRASQEPCPLGQG